MKPPYRFAIQIPQKIHPGMYGLTADGAIKPREEFIRA
jgi:hypothetical protein